MKIAVIGCGNIAGPYLEDLLTYDSLTVTGVADADPARAEAFREKFGVNAYASTEALLADPDVELVLNLTPHHAHKAVTEQALNAGKHVYSEKPLALTSADAWELVELAKARGLRLAGAPFSVIGEAQQTAWKYIRDGKLGTVRVVYADVNWGRIESWHPAPEPFYKVGALFDVGVYQLAILTAIFGPARSVYSYGRVLYPDRKTKDGTPFTVTTPDWILTLLTLADGTQVRLSTNFYVANETTRQVGMEFHGDLGSLHLESMFEFNAEVSYAKFGEAFQPVELVRDPYAGIPWGRGVYAIAAAIEAGQPHAFTGEQAAHLVDILNAANRSMATGETVKIESDFPMVHPAEWAT